MFSWLSLSLLLSFNFSTLDNPQDKGVQRFTNYTCTLPWELNLQHKFLIPPDSVKIFDFGLLPLTYKYNKNDWC